MLLIGPSNGLCGNYATKPVAGLQRPLRLAASVHARAASRRARTRRDAGQRAALAARRAAATTAPRPRPATPPGDARAPPSTDGAGRRAPATPQQPAGNGLPDAPEPPQLPAQMRSTRKAAGELFDNPILIGTITILVVIVAVYLSYIAENGLPFVPTYNINVDVANAGRAGQERRRPDRRRARRAGADDHAGAARHRPGLAAPVRAARARARARASSRCRTTRRYQVRLASVLGGKYLEIIPGQRPNTPHAGASRRRHVPPQPNAAADHHNLPFVDLDTAFAHVRAEDADGAPRRARRARRRVRRPRRAVQRRDLLGSTS